MCDYTGLEMFSRLSLFSNDPVLGDRYCIIIRRCFDNALPLSKYSTAADLLMAFLGKKNKMSALTTSD